MVAFLVAVTCPTPSLVCQSTPPYPKQPPPAPAPSDEPQPPALAESDPSSELEEAPTVATLVVTADAACSLYLGGSFLGTVEPGTPLEVEAKSLELALWATAVDLPQARWTEDLTLEAEEVREISIPVLETIYELRRKERREQVFRDLDQGLMWARRDNASDVSWKAAGSFCEELELGGFDDWRLPTLEELKSLEAIWSLRPLKIAEQIQLSACCLWSATEGSGSAAWNMDFRFRRAFELNRSLSFGHRALCRRPMTEEELAESRLAADPKERKRRLKEKRLRADERKRRRSEKAKAGTETGEVEPPQ